MKHDFECRLLFEFLNLLILKFWFLNDKNLEINLNISKKNFHYKHLKNFFKYNFFKF